MRARQVKERIDTYEENKKRVESNKTNHIPFYGFNKLQNFVPGVMPGIMYKVTSHMGVGKTQISKYMFVIQPLLYAIKYNKNYKILYFALEESESEFLDGLFIHVIRRLYKIQLDRFALMGMSKTPLTRTELDAIKKAEMTVRSMMEHVEVIDYSYKPTDMFNTCLKFAQKWGTFKKDANGKIDYDSYVPNDPNQIVLVVTDHISLVERDYDPEIKNYLNQMQSIARWHTAYGKRILTKKWNWAMLNIQQQSLESEKQQYTMKGDSIISKILPTLDGLANNKEVARDDYVVFGLFAPDRYAIKEYKGYHIANNTPQSFGDRFRSFHLLKNRFGHPNKILPLYFDGRYNYFKEMCLPTDPKFANFTKLLKS
jgi:hypothetical protein